MACAQANFNRAKRYYGAYGLVNAYLFPWRPRRLVRDFALQRRVNLCALACAKEKGLHIFDQKVLVIRVDRAQPVMIDKLILRRQPRLPAGLANLGVNLFAQRVAKGRFLQTGQLLLATRTRDNFCHNSLSFDGVFAVSILAHAAPTAHSFNLLKLRLAPICPLDKSGLKAKILGVDKGPLAQLVEQQTLNLRVVGSSPTRLILDLTSYGQSKDCPFYFVCLQCAKMLT
jgi:hypothetical protein